MTDRTVHPHADTGRAVEEPTLSDLHAHRKLHKDREHSVAPVVAEPATDLSSASIKSIPVPRVSARRERREPSQIRTPRPTLLSASIDQKTEKGAAPANPRSNGIFTNPFYRYEGGPFARLITFLANVLKFLEQLLLRGLGAVQGQQPAPVPQPSRPAATTGLPSRPRLKSARRRDRK